VVRPQSCRVIYYFDTPTLGRRHQLFGRVTTQQFSMGILFCCRTIMSGRESNDPKSLLCFVLYCKTIIAGRGCRIQCACIGEYEDVIP